MLTGPFDLILTAVKPHKTGNEVGLWISGWSEFGPLEQVEELLGAVQSFLPLGVEPNQIRVEFDRPFRVEFDRPLVDEDVS